MKRCSAPTSRHSRRRTRSSKQRSASVACTSSVAWRGARSRAGFATRRTIRSCFVNLHTLDLEDEELYDANQPLSAVAERVVLEITERANFDGVTDVPRRVARLRELGYRIAVDDLGAGYAGLTAFAQLVPEVVKIDMSLVRDVAWDLVRQRLVGAVIEASRSLRMVTVAEGVESTEERDTLPRSAWSSSKAIFSRSRPPISLVKVD